MLINDLTEVRKNYTMLESKLSVSRTLTVNQKKQMIEIERQCCNYEQYSRRERLEVVGIPSNTEDSKL